MDVSTELRRLRGGPATGERVQSGGLFVGLEVLTLVEASIVAARLREALIAVIEGTEEGVSDVASWASRLPGWLVDAFEGLPTSPVGQWSLPAWVHWYEPRRREWFFWGVEVIDAHFLVVQLETLDLPYSGDSLVFLLYTAGAGDVSEPILQPLP